MNLKRMIAALRSQIAAQLALRNAAAAELDELRSAETTDQERVDELRGQKATLDAEIDALEERVAELEAELRADEVALERQSQITLVTPGQPARGRYDESFRVGQEPRTYARETDPTGQQFLRDVAADFMRTDPTASGRLARHMVEERVERESAGRPLQERAAGTGAFTGLVVPQYLVDEFAPLARAARPFADACRHHDLPATGMTVYIGRVTTGTDTGEQTTENTAVTEQDIDDTLISVPVRTVAGQGTLSRQAVERGIGVDDVTVEDLFGSYNARLDNLLLNRATTGLTNVATAVTYTDASPTGAELYPKLLAGAAASEAALLNQAVAGDAFATMHSRRWFWLQAQMTSTWPLIGQPNIAAQQGGVNYADRYGSGFRGVLPNGTPVIVDNNIATNLGAGTNEDEIYLSARSECHLWEDPNAPMLIRAEQAKAASLGILLVVYGYAAWLFDRRPHAQKISGTGLITPTF